MPISEPSLALPVCRDVSVLSIERRATSDTLESDLFTLIFRTPGWQGWHPGQFVMLRPESATRPDILWARPFSISEADAEETRIVFQVAGRGTKDMLGLQRGEKITVWGPLGNAFAVSRTGPTLLLAGGIGIAPFVGYIKDHPSPESLRLEFGHRYPLECYPFQDCTGVSCGLIQATSHHERCSDDLQRFISVLDQSIQETAAKNGLVIACGPMPFLRSVQSFSLRHKVRTQLSLETRMACGVGACLGCVVKSTAGKEKTVPDSPAPFSYVQTCTKGPVFWADAIDLQGQE